jgi:predicted lipoprotein
MKRLLLMLTLFMASPVLGQANQIDIGAIVDTHILVRTQTLADTAATLSEVAATDCNPNSADLRTAYGAAFDAWISVSHLRFGPSEENDRAFALAFWPDSRGATPKQLNVLIADQDPVIKSEAGMATVSIAARGFYALEFLLFDPGFLASGQSGSGQSGSGQSASGQSSFDQPSYHCDLIKALSADIAQNSAAINQGWQNGFGDLLRGANNDLYRSHDEAARQLFTALTTGLQFTSDTRLGRPMGSFDNPRPKRAEARRANRSLRHVVLSLRATGELAALMAPSDQQMHKAFKAAITKAEALDDPALAGVATPIGRLRVEVLQQAIDQIRTIIATDIGPQLGISAGFNALDGD